MSDRRRLATYVVPYVLMAALQYQFGKDGVRFVDPMTFMGVRYLIAATVCFAIAGTFRPIVNRNTLLLSFFTFLSSALWALGLEYVTAAQSTVLSYTMPLFAIPLSALMLKEKTGALGWAGAFLGFLGVLVYGLALTSSGGSMFGAALTIANAFFWALYTIYYRKLIGQDPIRTVATQFFIGALFFLPFIPFTYSLNPTPEFFVDLGYVSLVGGVATLLLWNFLVRMEKISRVTTIVFAVPATSVVIQALLSDELPTALSVAGICVMFAGIYVSRLQPRNRQLTVLSQTGSEITPGED